MTESGVERLIATPEEMRRMVARMSPLKSALPPLLSLAGTGIGYLLVGNTAWLIPFALIPLVVFCRDRSIMGDLVNQIGRAHV